MTEEVVTVYRWTNGMVMVFGSDGEQVPELQGKATPERLASIRARTTPDTRWHGFGEDGPLEWP